LKKYPIIAALAFLFVISVWLVLSDRAMSVSAVPFGLPAGTRIPIQEKADFPSMPAGAEAELRKANDLRMAGALPAAQANYETILLRYPNLPAALFGAAYSILAEDTASAERITKARNLIEGLAQQMPGSVWIQLLLIFIKEQEGNPNYALDMAAKLAARSPAFSEARLKYANLLLKTEQASKAADEARAAISISAGADARAYVSLAFALHNMGKIEECSELVNYALPRFPSQTDLLLLHGYLSEYSRDFDNAQSAYKKILALKPGDANATTAMITLGEKRMPETGVATTISLKDQAREAAKVIIPLIEEYPENLPLREALGRIYLKSRMLKEARTQFSEIYAQDFEYPNIRKLLDESSEEQQKIFTPPPLPLNSKKLADSLAKTFAALRESEKSDYDESGRYLVHYGATFKEFFSKYSVTRFDKIDERTFNERYNIEASTYDNTVFFDSNNQFYATRSIITGSVEDLTSYDYIPDLFGHFLRKESGILGEGTAVGITECSGDRWSGVIWASRDNFEILMQNYRNTRKVFILRLYAKRFSDTGNLCSYVNMVTGKYRVPRI
jgi:tetratricopeptide (TPR) repeat protein